MIAAAMLLLCGCSDSGASTAPQETEVTLETVLLSGADTTAVTTAATTTTSFVEGAVLVGSATDAQSGTDSTETTVLTESAPIKEEPDLLPNTQTGTFDAKDLQITYRGAVLKPELDINTVLSALGTPDSQLSAPSCNYDGDDKTFTYGDMTIYTYPAGDADKILEIEVSGSSVTANRGGTVGMTQDEITAIYGTSYTTEGSTIRYTAQGGYLYFYIEGGVVTAFGLAGE